LLGKADLPRVIETKRLWDEATGEMVDPDALDQDEETQELPSGVEEGNGEEPGDGDQPTEEPSC
jgi:hypothetical protein